MLIGDINAEQRQLSLLRPCALSWGLVVAALAVVGCTREQEAATALTAKPMNSIPPSEVQPGPIAAHDCDVDESDSAGHFAKCTIHVTVATGDGETGTGKPCHVQLVNPSRVVIAQPAGTVRSLRWTIQNPNGQGGLKFRFAGLAVARSGIRVNDHASAPRGFNNAVEEEADGGSTSPPLHPNLPKKIKITANRLSQPWEYHYNIQTMMRRGNEAWRDCVVFDPVIVNRG